MLRLVTAIILGLMPFISYADNSIQPKDYQSMINQAYQEGMKSAPPPPSQQAISNSNINNLQTTGKNNQPTSVNSPTPTTTQQSQTNSWEKPNPWINQPNPWKAPSQTPTNMKNQATTNQNIYNSTIPSPTAPPNIYFTPPTNTTNQPSSTR